MKIGLSSYSFHQAVSQGRMNLLDVVDWIADHGGTHIELATGFGSSDPMCDLANLPNNPALIEALAERTAARGIVIAQIAMPCLLWAPDLTSTHAEDQIANVQRYLDVCQQLGIGLLRHDVVGFDKYPGDTSALFDQALPEIIPRAKRIAQYAAERGVITSLENHGFFVQNSERVRRVVRGVAEPNFKTTVDVGNFLCVDEDPLTGVRNDLPFASIVHLKDFYIRNADPGTGFFQSTGGRYLRGAILGQGDMDLVGICDEIRTFGWEGYVTLEFEGAEDCLYGCEVGLANARRLLNVA